MPCMNAVGHTVYLRRSPEQIARRLSPYGRRKRPRLQGLDDERAGGLHARATWRPANRSTRRLRSSSTATRCPTTSWSNISCKLSPTVADNRPIGIYDSGLGGLTVWREVRRALPGESLALPRRRRQLPLRLAAPRGGAGAGRRRRGAARGAGLQDGRRGLQHRHGRRHRLPARKIRRVCPSSAWSRP